MDPDEVVLRDPEEWRQIVSSARPIVVHVMETLAKNQDINDAKVKTAIAAQITPLIEDVPSAIERDTYRQQLARLLKVDEKALLGNQKVVERSRRRTERVEDPARMASTGRVEKSTDQRVMNLENHCVSLLLFRPDAIYELERELKRHNLEKFSPNDFSTVENQTICRLLLEGLEQDEQDVIPYIEGQIPLELVERFEGLITDEEFAHTNQIKVQRELVRVLVDLRLININTALSQLKFLQEDPEIPAEEKNELSHQILQLTINRGKLERVMTKSNT